MNLAQDHLNQNAQAKQIARSKEFHLKAFGQSINDFTLRLVNSNNALVQAIDKAQSIDTGLVVDVINQDTLLFAIENGETYDYAHIIVPNNGGEITFDASFKGHTTPIDPSLQQVADQFIGYITEHRNEFAVQASEVEEA